MFSLLQEFLVLRQFCRISNKKIHKKDHLLGYFPDESDNNSTQSILRRSSGKVSRIQELKKFWWNWTAFKIFEKTINIEEWNFKVCAIKWKNFHSARHRLSARHWKMKTEYVILEIRRKVQVAFWGKMLKLIKNFSVRKSVDINLD